MKKRQHRLKFETVSVLDNFLECIFPPRCFVCDRLLETADIRRQRNVHAACRKKLYPVVQPYCYHCGSPLADTETEYCQNCRKHRSFVAEGRSLFVYRGAVQKSMFKVIEKAILDSELGITPENNGEIIRLSIPPLTEERRKALVKQSKQEAENAKVSVRNARRDAIDGLKKAQKEGMPEDVAKDGETSAQKLHDKYMKKIDDMFAEKEKEILTV